MAITKILARNSRLDAAINYVINGDKTEDHILTAYLNCDPGRAFQQMMETKEEIGKTGGRQCYHIIQSFKPGEVTPELKASIMRFEQYRAQFAFLRDNGISTKEEMAAFVSRTEDALATLTKQRTILNVRKKKRQALYAALADTEALAPAKEAYEDGLTGMEAEYERYMEAVAALEGCGIPREALKEEKAGLYEKLAELNRKIRMERKKLAMCREILDETPKMERELKTIETVKEVKHDERRRR